MKPSLSSRVRGKRVAIVGRAGSILGTGNGPAIDGADVVIRVNWLLPIPPELVPDVGSRTDLLYTCRRCATSRRLGAALGVPALRLDPKRRKLATIAWFDAPARVRSSTGFIAVLDVLRAGAKRVNLYGFDCFKSEHFQERTPDHHNPLGSRSFRWSHDFDGELDAWRKLIRRHRRVKPDKVFREVLK